MRASYDFAFRKTREHTKMLTNKARTGRRMGAILALFAFAISTNGTSTADEPKQDRSNRRSNNQKVSYDKEIRPVFQARCQGCHQSAKAGGRYVMTSFDLMLKGGESGDRAISPSRPEESHLLEMITPENGKAQMPQDRAPLRSQ